MGAKRRRRTPTQRVYATLEVGHYDEMGRVMAADKKWTDEAAFVRDAVIEKIERWKKEHPGGPPPRS